MTSLTATPNETTSTSLLVSVDEARRLLGGVSPATFYRLLQRGELPAVKLAGRRFVKRDDLARFVAELSE